MKRILGYTFLAIAFARCAYPDAVVTDPANELAGISVLADGVLGASGAIYILHDNDENLKTLAETNEDDIAALESATSNLDNTSDADKPVSTATQTALDLKADADGSNLTVPTATTGDDDTTPASTAFVRQEINNVKSINLEYNASEIELELDYDAETGTFTRWLYVTGTTSGATGRIDLLEDTGTTGTLHLSHVSGTFQDGEELTDTSTGDGDANGVGTAVTNPLGSDDSYTGPVLTGMDAGETMAQWSVGGFSASGTIELTDSSDGDLADAIGLVVAASTAGNPVVLMTKGWVRNDSDNWTAGGKIYAVDGVLGQTKPSAEWGEVVGYAPANKSDVAYLDFSGDAYYYP